MPDISISLSGIRGFTPTFSGFPSKESSQFNLDPATEDGYITDGFMNPFRTPGFMSPVVDVVTTITTSSAYTGIIQAAQVNEPDSEIYFFERSANPDIYKLSSFTDTEADIVNSVTAAAGGGTDLEIYSVNGVRALFYTYRKTGTGGGDMGMYNFSSFNNTFLSGTAANGFNLGTDNQHRMIVADDGMMYILDGPDVHRFNGKISGGTNGTGEFRILQAVSPYQFIDGVNGKGLLWLGLLGTTRDITGTDVTTTAEVPCGVYVWNRRASLDLTSADFVPISGVKEINKMFWFEGTPWCFTFSTSRTTQIRQYNGREFEIQFELHRGAKPRFPDSVQVREKIVYWIGRDDGIIYVMGRVYKGAPLGIWKIGTMNDKISGQTFSSGGALAIAGGQPGVTSGDYLEPETMVINFSTGTTENFVRKFYPHSRTITGETLNSHTGDIRSIVKHLPKLSDVSGITLLFPQLDSGSSNALSLQVFKNRSSKIAQTATLTQTDGQRGWYYMPLAEHNVNSIQLGFRYTTAVVVSSQIQPEYAIIHYEPTTKLR